MKYEIKPSLQKILKRLYKKDKNIYNRILSKINEIINSGNIEHYKNLKYPLQYLKRVHIGSFVLVFSFDKKKKIVYFENFKHHDQIYKITSV